MNSLTLLSRPFLLFLLFAFLCSCVLCVGETPWADLWVDALQRFEGTSGRWNPLLDERLPRLIVLLCSGASLAVSGAVMQALFQNPLAAPNILGISVGGTLLAIFVLIMGWHMTYPFAIPIASVVGCLFTLLFVYGLTCRFSGAGMMNLVLTGIAVSTVLIAMKGALLYSLRDHWQLIQTISEWEAGSTLDRTWQHVHMQLPLTLVGLGGCYYYRYELNILSLGEEEALNLGVDTKVIRWRLILCVALLTGGALSGVGIVAFFGLILPHIIRNLWSSDNRIVVPLSIYLGAITLAAMDLAIRLFHIRLFTIGNISAVLGGLFFLILLFDRRRMQCVP